MGNVSDYAIDRGKSMQVISKWDSTQPLPDEEYLRAINDADVAALERELEAEVEAERRNRSNDQSMLEAAGLNELALEEMESENRAISQMYLRRDMDELSRPTFDIEDLHQRRNTRARSDAQQSELSAVPMSGALSPSYGGGWRNFQYDEPTFVCSDASRRIELKAQARGKGLGAPTHWSDCHAFLAYTLRPPASGHLGISAYTWLHGFYSIYSNDAWWKNEYASATLATWIDVHQEHQGWRSPEYVTRFSKGGYEIHPTLSRRIDREVNQQYWTQVGASDLVTIRIGVRLHCEGRASAGRATLDFFSGDANFVHIPQVWWKLEQ